TKNAELAALRDWMDASHPIPREREKDIEALRKLLDEFKNDWNETDLRVNFIGPLLFFVDFRGETFVGFNDAPLSAVVGEYRIYGYVDWMAARKSPSNTPLEPYFFVHEYKKFRATEADPLGQLLAEMLAAQTLNTNGRTVYGCYVVSNFWHFVVLEDYGYATSQGFDATDQEELARIWSALTEAKMRIQQTIYEAEKKADK
ncbi:MAG: hypothetical protein NZ534_03545, partial [Bacteroidia bacterium]|nr:hypothetical protein [Bacteroidia bacterium]